MKTIRMLLLPMIVAAGSLIAIGEISDVEQTEQLRTTFGLGVSYCETMSPAQLEIYLEVVRNEIFGAKNKNVKSALESGLSIDYTREKNCESCQEISSFLDGHKRKNELKMLYFNAGELTGEETRELLKKEENDKKYRLIANLIIDEQLKK
jgi:hypothetical protein